MSDNFQLGGLGSCCLLQGFLEGVAVQRPDLPCIFRKIIGHPVISPA